MSFIKKTFGGLSASYYLRHLFFGAIFTALFIALMYSGGDKRIFSYIIFIANTFLYPYSRFVYESVADFVFGDNVFFVKCAIFTRSKIYNHAALLRFCFYYCAAGAFVSILLSHEKQNL